MNWFERHLNWTAVIAPIVFFVLVFLTIYIIYFFSAVPVYNDYPPVDLAIVFTLAFSNLIMFWLLRRKKQSLIFLLFFILPFIILVTFYIDNKYWIFPVNDSSVFAYDILPPGGIILWILGWILVLILKKRPTLPLVVLNSDIKTLNIRNTRLRCFLHKIFVPFPRLKYLIPCLVIVFVLIMGNTAGNSTVGRDSRYVAYSNTINSGNSNITFSFEYPRFFDLNSDKQIGLDKFTLPTKTDDIFLIRYKFIFFEEVYDEFAFATVIPADIEDHYWAFTFNSKMNTLDKALAGYYKWDLSQRNQDLVIRTENPVLDENNVNVLENKPVTISGIQADYIVLGERVEHSHAWSTFRFVYFKHNGLVYVFEMATDGTRYKPYFDHLLETFKITEN